MPTPNCGLSFHPDFLSVELTNHCKNDSSKGRCPSAVPPPPPPLQQHTPLCACCSNTWQTEHSTFSPLDLQFHLSAVWKGVNNSNPQHGRKQRSLLFNLILYKHCCTWWLMPAIPKFENLRQEVQAWAQEQPELHIKTYHSCTHTQKTLDWHFYNKANMLESRACK